MTAAASAGGLLPTRALFHESWKWLRKNWIRTLVFSLLSFVIAWGWNVWIMARKLEGSVAEPGSSTTATAQGHPWNGVYWLLCTTILFGLITYGREKGFKNLLREFFTPPFTFFDNLVRRPRSAIAMGFLLLRRPRPFAQPEKPANPASAALLRLRRLHSGQIGDYVAWAMLGFAALGGALALTI